jgi:anthranilate/para-aminobenzoate synthase component I
MEWSVAIRTAVAAEGRIWYLAGCGITAESVPAEELAESDVKAAAFLEALSGSSSLPTQESIRSKG